MTKKPEKIQTNDQALMVTTATIRAHYLRRKADALGSAYKPSARHMKHEYWVNAAKQCIRLEADPMDYVDAAFCHSGQKSGPFPNTLAGAAAERWYREYSKSLTSRGIRAAVLIDGEITQVEDVSMVNLATALDTIRVTMFNRSGDLKDLKSPENIRTLRMRVIPLWSPGRALLGFPDPQVMEDFGQAAYVHFTTHPGEVKAARQLKLPIDEMLEWIRTHYQKVS